MDLDELHQEVLKESFNMGIGKAAAIVSEMVNKEVKLSVPSLKVSFVKDLIESIESDFDGDITAVYQNCSDPLKGTALLVYSHESSLELIGSLLNSDSKPEKLGEVEAEALKDFGNITLTACLTEFGQVLDGVIETDFPQIIVGSPKKVITLDGKVDLNQPTLTLGMEFTIAGSQNVGKINLAFDSINENALKEKLDKYCKVLLGET